MRIRFKPWARPELEASSFYRDNPEELKNKWIQEFENRDNPIHLELGCGKGQFISQLAVQNSNINYIAIDNYNKKIRIFGQLPAKATFFSGKRRGDLPVCASKPGRRRRDGGICRFAQASRAGVAETGLSAKDVSLRTFFFEKKIRKNTI